MKKKFEGLLLIVDFDGTLACHGTISEENCRAVRYFQENGGLFTIASGRNPGWIAKWREMVFPNTWVSLINGAILIDPEEKEIAFCQSSGRELMELAPRIFSACPHLKHVEHNLETGYYRQMPEDVLSESILNTPVYKSMYIVPNEYSEEYAARVKEIVGEKFIVMRSWINGIEIQRKGTGKGDSVRRLKDLLGDRARLVVGAGNYENDIDLIEAADIGYAVGDSIPSLLAVADRVTVKCADHAIAAIIADLEREFANF
jgi:HAD superfamily hydrolase (TIGR01484 family)